MLNFISRARESIARRNRYNLLADEINGLSQRDLSDLRGDRAEMLNAAYQQVYGR